MKSTLFIVIVLISGALAGTIHGAVNFTIVEPYLDQAIGIENQNLFASGEEENTAQFWAEHESYRIWQKKWSGFSWNNFGNCHGFIIWNYLCIISEFFTW